MTYMNMIFLLFIIAFIMTFIFYTILYHAAIRNTILMSSIGYSILSMAAIGLDTIYTIGSRPQVVLNLFSYWFSNSI